jgi:phage terminase Nu1 subunit (DNA packaging protein)
MESGLFRHLRTRNTTTNKGDTMAKGNNKTINVKIPTVKVIKALEDRLTVINAEYKEQQKKEKEFEKTLIQWNKDIFAYALKNAGKASNLRINTRGWNGTINIDFDIPTSINGLPKEPERNFKTMTEHNYDNMVEEIENALRILKLTSEEEVSTSTYNSIAQYL